MRTLYLRNQRYLSKIWWLSNKRYRNFAKRWFICAVFILNSCTRVNYGICYIFMTIMIIPDENNSEGTEFILLCFTRIFFHHKGQGMTKFLEIAVENTFYDIFYWLGKGLNKVFVLCTLKIFRLLTEVFMCF